LDFGVSAGRRARLYLTSATNRAANGCVTNGGKIGCPPTNGCTANGAGTTGCVPIGAAATACAGVVNGSNVFARFTARRA
jgi:hypothetical protein